MESSIKPHYTASVVVTSDTCHRDPSKDESGQYVVQQLEAMNFSKVSKVIVEDDKGAITNAVKLTLQDPNNVLTITVGGTGLCPRDVTPEATSVLYEKACPGIVAALNMQSLRYSRYAALSRLTAGISNSCLIVNFPGSKRANEQCFACLQGFMEHAIQQVRFDEEAIKATHKKQDAQINVISHVDSPTRETRQDQETPEKVRESRESSERTSPTISLGSGTELLANVSSRSMTKDTDQTNGHSNDSKIPKEKLISLNSKVLVQNSPFPLIGFDHALSILNELASELTIDSHSVTIDSFESSQTILGSKLAEDLYSNVTIPPHPVSTMDGYVLNIPVNVRKFISSINVVHAALVSDFDTFIQCQNNSSKAKEFFCYQVNTGGRVPEDNFAIIPVEFTQPIKSNNTVPISKITLDEYVRKIGSDLNTDYCLTKGSKIGPVELSLIQTMGHSCFKVISEPVIGVISTGDELISPYEKAKPTEYSVVDINGPLICSILKQNNLKPVSLGISRDNPEEILIKIMNNINQCDILLVTGGASMGSKDHVKNVIEVLGGIFHFGRINIKPGKPAALASLVINNRRKFIFALPGNPVSAYVTTTVLVIPFIQQAIKSSLGSDNKLTLESIGELVTVKIGGILDADDNQDVVPYVFDGRMEFARASFMTDVAESENPIKLVAVSIRQQSSRLISLKDCDCLLIIEPCKKGSRFLVGQIYQALRVKQ